MRTFAAHNIIITVVTVVVVAIVIIVISVHIVFIVIVTGTSESRGIRVDLTAGVGRSWFVGIAPLGARVR